MIDRTSGGSAYNRFINIDGIEDRVIYCNDCSICKIYKNKKNHALI